MNNEFKTDAFNGLDLELLAEVSTAEPNKVGFELGHISIQLELRNTR